MFAAASEEFSIKLAELNELRHKDKNTFSQQLLLLSQDTTLTDLNEQQRNKLRLLQAWDLVLSGRFKQAIDIVDELEKQDNLSIQLSATSLKVNIHTLTSKYTEAFNGVERLLSALHFVDDEKLFYQIIGQVILLYNKIEHYAGVPPLIKHGLTITKDPNLLCRLQTLALPNHYHTLGYAEYETKFTEVIRLCDNAQELVFNLVTIRHHMFYLLEQQQPTAALEWYQQFVGQVTQLNYPLLTAGFKAAAAEAFLQQGELVSAAKLALAAEQHLPTDQHDPAVLATYRVLYRLAQAQENFQTLQYYAEKRLETELTIAREKASQQLAFQLANSETRLREQRIQLLDKDNELLTLERDLYQQQAEKRYLFLIFICSLSLILAAVTYRSLTRSQRFRRLAEFDQLTGISNRHHFYQHANIAAKYCEQNRRPLSVVVFDLDYFKKINDSYGHAMGDWALQQVVASCRNFMRTSDIFGRVGGEEFAIVLPDCRADKAEMLAEICRDAIANIDTSQMSNTFTLTASFGISEAAQVGYDISALLDAADKALYKAKDNGRNQVWCSD
ncbi:GGDEF domain-containing protein [Alishewanella longhuensis]